VSASAVGSRSESGTPEGVGVGFGGGALRGVAMILGVVIHKGMDAAARWACRVRV
jgi:hypothetical protein